MSDDFYSDHLGSFTPNTTWNPSEAPPVVKRPILPPAPPVASRSTSEASSLSSFAEIDALFDSDESTSSSGMNSPTPTLSDHDYPQADEEQQEGLADDEDLYEKFNRPSGLREAKDDQLRMCTYEEAHELGVQATKRAKITDLFRRRKSGYESLGQLEKEHKALMELAAAYEGQKDFRMLQMRRDMLNRAEKVVGEMEEIAAELSRIHRELMEFDTLLG